MSYNFKKKENNEENPQIIILLCPILQFFYQNQ